MDLLQIITGLLCVGAIVCLAYQIKELHHAFKNTDNFKDFLSNNDYDNQKLKVELDILEDKYLSLQKENETLKDELKTYRDCIKDADKCFEFYITKLEDKIRELEDENRKLKKKLPSSYWL
tara:strand:- start:94 stop:456 length:363 start_codon:yes stop_codon:yes gene_type:complete